jgi:O-antigen ligase/tetratricopeptide (TPR) repeat protein
VQATAIALLVTGGLAVCSRLSGASRKSERPWRSLRDLTADPVSRIMLVGTLVCLIATLESISPLTSWQGTHENAMGLATTLALLCVFLAARAILRNADEARIVAVAVALALLPVTAYALVQVAGHDPFDWDQTSPFAGWIRPTGTLGHPNYLGGYVVMALPLVVWLAIRSARENRIAVTAALSLLGISSIVVVIASLSRAAWLAGGVAAIVVLVTQIPLSDLRRRIAETNSRMLRNGRVLIVLAALPAVGLGLAVKGLPTPLRERLVQRTAVDARWPIWMGAWHIFANHPWMGCGPETFEIAIGKYGIADYWRIEWGIAPTRAHNDLLHILATQGGLGGVAFILLAGALAWSVRRAWRTVSLDDRPLVGALAAALAAWYVQNLFGFPVAPTASLFVILAALLSRLAWPVTLDSPQARRSSEGSPQARRASKGPLQARHASEGQLPSLALRACVLLAGATSIWFLVARPYLAGCACHRGEEVQAAAPVQALQRYERAVSLDPRRDVLWIKLGECALAAAERCAGSEERRRYLERAREASEEACRLVPLRGQNQANRGRILSALARDGLVGREDILTAFDEALRYDPDNTVFLADAASSAVALGRPDRACDYLKRGLDIDPTLAVLHSGMAALALNERRYADAEASLSKSFVSEWHGNAAALDRARSLLCVTYLDTGRGKQALDLANELLVRHEDSLIFRCLRAHILERLGRRLEALDEYRRVVIVRPDNVHARAGLARLREESHARMQP